MVFRWKMEGKHFSLHFARLTYCRQFYRLMTPSSVVPDYSNSIPWIDDPVQPGTNVCKTFRMYQVVYMWKELLQQLCKKVPLDRIIGSDVREQ